MWGKSFAMTRKGAGWFSVWCKGRPGAEVIMTGSDPDRFFVPPYVGHRGWLGVRVDSEIDWDELTDLLHGSCRMTAPKQLLRRET